MLLLLRTLELLALLGFYYLLSFGLVYSIYVRKGGNYALLTFIVVSVIIGPFFLILCNLFGTTISKVNFLFLLSFTFIANVCLLLYGNKQIDFTLKSPDNFFKRNCFTLAFFLFIGLSRIVQIGTLYVPNWIDGYNHFETASKLLLSRSLISKYTHLGFILSALFDYRLLSSLTQLGLAEIILVSGQKFNILTCISFYLLAHRIADNKFTPLFSTILYSFWAPFPSYLISWGRYPFLSGLSLFPLVFLFLVGTKEKKLNSSLLMITLIALLFYHYSVLLFAICILLAQIVLGLFEKKRETNWELIVLLILIINICIKLYGLFNHRDLFLDLSHTISDNAEDNIGHIFLLTWKNGGALVWSIGFMAMVSSVIKRSELNSLLTLTISLILLFYIVQFLAFEGFIFGFDNFVIMIPVFLCMYSISFIDRLLMIKSISKYAWIILVGFSLVGFNITLRIVNPVTILFTHADQSAFSWLVQNTTPKTIIYINSFKWKGKYIPSDGGAWITNLTGRRTIFAGSEEEILDFNESIRKQTPEYIYIGGGLGELDVSKITLSRNFELVYLQDDVSIFRILELP